MMLVKVNTELFRCRASSRAVVHTINIRRANLATLARISRNSRGCK